MKGSLLKFNNSKRALELELFYEAECELIKYYDTHTGGFQHWKFHFKLHRVMKTTGGGIFRNYHNRKAISPDDNYTT